MIECPDCGMGIHHRGQPHDCWALRGLSIDGKPHIGNGRRHGPEEQAAEDAERARFLAADRDHETFIKWGLDRIEAGMGLREALEKVVYQVARHTQAVCAERVARREVERGS